MRFPRIQNNLEKRIFIFVEIESLTVFSFFLIPCHHSTPQTARPYCNKTFSPASLPPLHVSSASVMAEPLAFLAMPQSGGGGGWKSLSLKYFIFPFGKTHHISFESFQKNRASVKSSSSYFLTLCICPLSPPLVAPFLNRHPRKVVLTFPLEAHVLPILIRANNTQTPIMLTNTRVLCNVSSVALRRKGSQKSYKSPTSSKGKMNNFFP